MGFTEQVIRDTLNGYPTDTEFSRGIAAGLKLALKIIETDKRVHSERTIAKEEVA